MKSLEIWLIQHIGRVWAFTVSIILRGIVLAFAIICGVFIVWFTGAIAPITFRSDEAKELIPVAQFLLGVVIWILLSVCAGAFWFIWLSPRWEAWNDEYPEQKDKQP